MTDSLRFRVRSSSSAEVYDVTAELVPRLRLSCSCPAGTKASVCKHRTAILLGDVTSVVEVDAAAIEQLSRTAAASPIGAIMREIDTLDAEIERVRRLVAAKKKQLARLMDEGV